MTKILIDIVKIYQKFLSGFSGRRCRFYPTCSQYAVEALQHFGFIKGSVLTFKRIIRCHPWNEGGYDPVMTKSLKKN